MVASVRNPPIIAGLANPLFLGLSAWGLDALLQIKLPKLGIMISDHSFSIPTSKIGLLILAIPLIWSLRESYVFSQNWLRTVVSDKVLYEIVPYLQTDDTEWVNFPYGDHFWIIPGFNANLKINNGFRTWIWKNRQDPPVYEEAALGAVDPAATNLIQTIAGVNILSHFENEYAFIQSGDQKIACKANAIGGNIDVVCPESPKGQLIVYENNWTGWYAWVDKTRAALLPSDWLSADAPAGKHTFHFRYRPWDVWVGISLTILGIVLSVVLWIKAKQTGNLLLKSDQ